ncbi:MAG: hypothetical protein EU541_07865 [Promethearchaeota archaeon]|nr:MAG: hypothetical protein EU541_07865 [Candidatus Lokiarchaeota archaeon]
MKYNKKLVTILIISLFFLTPFGLSAEFALSIEFNLKSADTTSNGVEYIYGEYIFDSWMNQTWDHTTVEINRSNSESGTYSYVEEYYTMINGSEVLKKVYTNVEYETNTSYYSNQTITGMQAYHLMFDSYNVNVSYGDDLNLIWYALKNGTMKFIQEVSELKTYEEYNMSEYNKFTKTTKIYNDTDNDGVFETQIDSSTDIYNQTYSQRVNYSYDLFENPSFENVSLMRGENSFSMIWPFIISNQIYTTVNNQKVAWGKMIFPEYILYNDTDNNGIYSLGESSSQGGFGMDYCDEYLGHISPQALGFQKQIQILKYNDGSNMTQTYQWGSFPSDISVEKLSENITFHEPYESVNGISWSIDYDEMPIKCSSCTNESCFSIELGQYKHCSPTNFTFGFNYNITENEADLSQTFGMSKITNDTFYNKVQGLSLCIPHYTYFLSSEEIIQETSNAATIQTDIINFTLAGIPTAQIDMGNIFSEKKNYTLYDYPSEGENKEIGALGATINQLIVNSQEKASIQGYSRVFMLKGLIMPTIENDPAFYNYTGLFTMASMNYPIWSGEKLLHDPTFIVFYSQPTIPGGGGTVGIDGFLYIPLFATIVITVMIIIKKRKDYDTKSD